MSTRLGRKKPAAAPPAAHTVVPLAELRDKLSRYVRAVQSEGRAITVTHHGRAAAVLGPAEPSPVRRSVRKALRPFGTTKFPRTGKGRTDSTALLLEERRKDRR